MYAYILLKQFSFYIFSKYFRTYWNWRIDRCKLCFQLYPFFTCNSDLSAYTWAGSLFIRRFFMFMVQIVVVPFYRRWIWIRLKVLTMTINCLHCGLPDGTQLEHTIGKRKLEGRLAQLGTRLSFLMKRTMVSTLLLGYWSQ